MTEHFLSGVKGIEKTISYLQDLAKVNSEVLVAFSGGKDSLVVLDLACKIFPTVVAYYQYMLPESDYEADRMALAKERYKNCSFISIPSWVLFEYLRTGVFCDEGMSKDGWPEYKAKDVTRIVQEATGIKLVLTGMRKTDNFTRRVSLDKDGEKRNVYHPVKDWNKHEILAYLVSAGIPVPQIKSALGNSFDITCHSSSVLWLKENFPRDFEKMRRLFPYIEAVLWRKELYGIPAG